MSTKTVESADLEAVPFFARFLEEQSASANSDAPPSDAPSTPPSCPPSYPLPFTYKFPSDLEDF